MTIIDIPRGFHDPDSWVVDYAAELVAAARAEELSVYTGPAVTVDRTGAYRVAAGTVRNRSKRGA